MPAEVAAQALVSVQAGDVLVVRFPRRLTEEEAAEAQKRLNAAFPEHAVLMLDSGTELAVVRFQDRGPCEHCEAVDMHQIASPGDEDRHRDHPEAAKARVREFLLRTANPCTACCYGDDACMGTDGCAPPGAQLREALMLLANLAGDEDFADALAQDAEDEDLEHEAAKCGDAGDLDLDGLEPSDEELFESHEGDCAVWDGGDCDCHSSLLDHLESE